MTIIILAAGAARRMGRQKLLLEIDGQTMVDRVVQAASNWPIVVVTSDEVAPILGPSCVCVVRNSMPERGMAHSLKLANAVVPQDEAIAILLADMPDITPAAIATVIAGYDADIDVVIPRHGGAYGHPVIFGPLARRKIAELPDGDTVQRLRDDERLRRRFIDGPAEPFLDIDTPADYDRRIGNASNSLESSR